MAAAPSRERFDGIRRDVEARAVAVRTEHARRRAELRDHARRVRNEGVGSRT
jgi:hypothetical protein